MNIIDINQQDSANKACKVLKDNGVIVFPTDTVYGIGCLMNNKTIKKLYKIKNRPLSQPTAILITNELYHCKRSPLGMRVNSAIDNIIKQYPKGQVTVIVNINNFNIIFPNILVKDKKIGIRIPDNKWLEKLIDKVGPIVASSANKKGERTPTKFLEIDTDILSQADLVIKTSEKLSGKASIVYDLENDTILRN